MGNKQNKVFFGKGVAWFFDKFGNRKSVSSLDEANNIQSECCGIDCCNNLISLPVNDNNGTDTYPATIELIKAGATYSIKVTIDTGSGITVKTVDLS